MPVSHSTQRIAMLVEYIGTHYCGSQYQCQGKEVRPTIQHAIQQALAQLNVQASPVVFSGRTDAGVHAHGQVVHVDVPVDGLCNVPDLKAGLNRFLPQDIRVRAVEVDVTQDFHALKLPERRWYRYTVLNTPELSVWDSPNALWVPQSLHVEKMCQAAGYLVGRQNFKSFKCPDTHVENDMCYLSRVAVTRENNLIYFDFVSDRFLYKMVRNLVGLLISVGKDRETLSPSIVQEILDRQDRTYQEQCRPTVKPHGLSLMAVQYPSRYNYFLTCPYVTVLSQQMDQQTTVESLSDENILSQAS